MNRYDKSPLGDAAGIDAVVDSIERVVRALRNSTAAVERELGINGAQLFVLHVLRNSPAESLNDLAARTHTHQSSVSVVVTRLADRGLVSRERSDADVRCVRIALTPEGEDLLSRAPGPIQQRLTEALAGMRPDVVANLSRGLTGLTAAMAISDQPPEMFFEGGGSPGL